jgi:monoamine oxidase
VETEILIVGGGLSGLALAEALQRAGVDFQLVEARDRLGGRVKSARVGRAGFDLGPSWFWPGQERMSALVRRYLLPVFEQHSSGEMLFEEADGRIGRAGGAPMAGSLRVHGGMSALTGALGASLDPDRVRLGAALTGIRDGTPVVADLSDGSAIRARRTVLAMPPRLTAGLAFHPGLPRDAADALRAIPTWMAGQAKLVAVYAIPFWRPAGLSGDAMSRRGPLVEIHDACDPAGDAAALFGFVGVPAELRASRSDGIKSAAIEQLGRLFGPAALEPRAVFLEDWALAAGTSMALDRESPPTHPVYGLPAALNGLWEGRLLFASTETAPVNGGFLEGALEAADLAYASLTALR